MRRTFLALSVLIFAGCVGSLPAGMPGDSQGQAPGRPAASSAGSVDAAITNALGDILSLGDRARVDLADSEGKPVGDLLGVGSPVGYQLRARFLNIGVPLAEALASNDDPVFRQKLIELARWERSSEVRAAALFALAHFHDPAHHDIFREALLHRDVGVRSGAVEAVIEWGNRQLALPLLTAAAERDREPFLRVYASAGLVRLQDPAGLSRLRAFLDAPSWLVRAMAARYLGEFGEAQDYDLLLSRLDREVPNDFVVAEYCIAALKLSPKKDPASNR